ncbi:MAG: MOSC domain-containing protein [Candidatus Binatia bacterium]
MRLISVNVGMPREIVHNGKAIVTGIFKEPVHGRVRLGALNLDGDRQADLSVHGGPSKAVYVYPKEHYDFWRGELSDMELSWGAFGENFTTEGLFEDKLAIGDYLRIGTAQLMAGEPRLPCFKLTAKFGRDDMIKKFLRSRRTGFYLAVITEGEVGAGDPIEWFNGGGQVIVAELTEVYLHRKHDVSALQRMLNVKPLSTGWRRYFEEQLAKAERGAL